MLAWLMAALCMYAGCEDRCAAPLASADTYLKTITLDGGLGSELCIVENYLFMSHTSVIQCKISFIMPYNQINKTECHTTNWLHIVVSVTSSSFTHITETAAYTKQAHC